MAISKKLNFKRAQLRKFARLLKAARLARNMTQLQVAQAAFGYEVSHCKVSRVERCAMPLVDAHCLEAMATVLGVDLDQMSTIDPKFKSRAVVVREATRRGFWSPKATQVATDRVLRG